MTLRGKVAIVTGAGGTIGGAIADALAAQGSHVALLGRDDSRLHGALKSLPGNAGESMAVTADVTREDQVSGAVGATLERFGTVDILVNCAGVYGPIGLSVDADTGEWINAILVNLCGTFICMKAVLPIMAEKRKGKIVNLSGGGAVSPFARFSAYSASKAAVVRLTETLAREFLEYNIDINAIAPGPVNSRMLDEVLEAGEAAGDDFLARCRGQALDGGVPPDSVAELAVFLSSAESDGCSGKLISLLWDDWRAIPERLEALMSSDVYTMRRIVPGDRGFDWEREEA